MECPGIRPTTCPGREERRKREGSSQLRVSGGRPRTGLEIGSLSDEWDAQLSISANTSASTPAEASRAVRSWMFSLDGDRLELTDTSSEIDFTHANGNGVSATEVVVLFRQ
jgi:hypothetical protein